ncbi:MAG: S-methyl-5-thioribose-1-phosphate isomerase [Candidatus Hodarchaeales archaeon]|jgi:translation initiation factor eIF-2B subunit alpha/methylthioribose-1-phosphate isomerase
MRLQIDGKIVDKPAVWWENKEVCMIDQTKIPFQIEIFKSAKYQETVHAIKDMIIRGAPSIGAAAAYGLVQAITDFWQQESYEERISEAYDSLMSARPTAVDLKNGLDFVKNTPNLNPESALAQATLFAERIAAEGFKIGQIGKTLIKDDMNILTHCHTGALALVDHGSALSPLIQAWEDGVRFHVYVDETRPRLQGKMTSWELKQYGIDHTVVCDSASGLLMSQGEIDMVILGADRVTRNGDIANKIGTYNLAVLAKYHNIPFYSAFPRSTYDLSTLSGNDIEIEERSGIEVQEVSGYSIKYSGNEKISLYLDNTSFRNPAFDITPAKLITGYITSNGVLSTTELEQFFN